MACPNVLTGSAFVTRALTHVDCQAEYLGTFGYQSLANPASPAALLVSGLITIYLGCWGYRLMFGPAAQARELVSGILKIGIALTIAFSWPVFHVVVYRAVLNGPAQIATSFTTPGPSNPGSGFVNRLQAADNAIVRLTEQGTGRRSGQYLSPDAPGGTFRGAANDDESNFGLARLAYLVGLIGTLALVRLAAGLLLALAPVAAGLLLFPWTRALFTGWVHGLCFAFLAAIAITLTMSVELAVLETWLADALYVRGRGYAAPSAPLELFAICAGFAVIHLGIVWLAAKIAFNAGWARQMVAFADRFSFHPAVARPSVPLRASPNSADRVEVLARRLETRVGLEQDVAEAPGRSPSHSASLRDRSA